MSKLITIVSPCYNEEENVRHCADVVRDMFATNEILQKYDYEHIFADNASLDQTVDILRGMAEEDPHIKVVLNARNYGPFRSTFNALKYAKGDAIVPMFPVDLQDPPELIPQFAALWEQGNKRVYGVRVEREESFLLKFCRKTYYWMVNKFSSINIPRNVTEFQLIDRQVLNALMQYKDYYPYIRGMLFNVGFQNQSASIPYTWKERKAGISKNNFFNLVDQALNGLISFTNFPMRVAVFAGFTISVLSILYAIIQLCINLFAAESAPSGIPTLIVALFFFSGLQFALLGILGEYISAIHFQVRQGNVVIEQEKINIEEKED
jgi:glycosyltransferase involved in cell wall biosynthesis